MIIEGESRNTFQNVQFSSRLLEANGFDQVYLVTSGVHLKRALIYFAHFMAAAPSPAPSDRLAAVVSVMPLAQNFAYMDIALHESIGLLRYEMYNVLGWNAGSRKAGAF